MGYTDESEKEIIESYNRGEWVSAGSEKKGDLHKAAGESMLKNKRINIRLTQKDYHDIRIKAMEEGLPYQALISSIIHKYNKGDLK